MDTPVFVTKSKKLIQNQIFSKISPGWKISDGKNMLAFLKSILFQLYKRDDPAELTRMLVIDPR